MPSFPQSWSKEDRLKVAKSRTERLIDHITGLFEMHEANVYTIYDGRLASQIPRSYAGHAFNQFQTSMYLFEVIRLAALWDPPSADRESIPTIIALIDETGIIDSVIEEVRDYYLNDLMVTDLNPTDDPHLIEAKRSFMHSYREEKAEKESRTALERLRCAINECASVRQSEQLAAIRYFRDRYIAHNLELPSKPKAEAPRKVKYGDETWLLEKTVEIADHLHLSLNGSTFDWEGARKIARKCSEELWRNCNFQIANREHS